MIEACGLTKRYGSTLAVNELSCTVHPGVVTGFLGPNGAGKTTTMRMILGLDSPSAGAVTINGQPYAQLASPMREVGALLEARAVHGGRSARSHLRCLAQTNDIPERRVDEALGLVGLAEVAGKRSKGYSLGMSQRLGIAAALLGNPGIVMFDEPVNGLDPEGILWIRTLMRSLAAEGRTVFVSSHLMSEMENTADHLIVIGRGRLIADCSMAEFIARGTGQAVLVRTPQPDALARAVTAAGGAVTQVGGDDLEVRGLPKARLGDLALASGIAVHHLAPARASLEEAFMELTADSVEYQAGVPSSQPLAESVASGHRTGHDMAAITTERTAPAVGPARGRRAGLAGAIRSEFTKLRSVRSTYWSLLLLVLAGIAWSVANCAGVAAHWGQTPPGQRGFFDATQDSVVGLALLGQLVVVVLGALAITSEYSTGMIRTSLTVLPRRGVVFAAKAIVLTAVTLVIAMVASFAAFFIGQYLLRGTHEAATLGQPDVLRAVLASALYVALSGLFSLGLGAMLRSTAGALTAAYGLLFLVPQLAKALPSQWYADLVRWLPGGEVTNAITNTQRQLPQHLFTARGELAVFGGYTAIVLVVGALLLRRRDA